MREKIGRKLRYGEPTEVLRVPVSMIPMIQEMLKKREITTVQWEDSQLPPKAQKLIDVLTELMLVPQKGLIEALKATGLPGYNDEIKQLNHELEETRRLCHGMTTDSLLEVLSD